MSQNSASNAYDVNRGGFLHIFYSFLSAELADSFTKLLLLIKSFLYSVRAGLDAPPSHLVPLAEAKASQRMQPLRKCTFDDSDDVIL